MNLTKKAKDRNTNDLYGTKQDVIDAMISCALKNNLFHCTHIDDPTAGDGRIGLSLSRAFPHCSRTMSDINPTNGAVDKLDVMKWERPYCDKLLVAQNPPFNLMDQIVERIWFRLKRHDQMLLLISTMALASETRVNLWRDMGILPLSATMDIRWRTSFDGASQGSPLSLAWILSSREARNVPGRQYDLIR